MLAFPREEINVVFTQTAWDEREKMAGIVGPGGTMGPIPTSFTSTLLKDAFKEASTYAYRFGNMNVWKVGWAHDAAGRLEDLNKHVPSEVLDDQRWGGGWTQKWASATQAYEMERRVLGSFPDEAKYGERVHCTAEALEAAWRKAWKDV